MDAKAIADNLTDPDPNCRLLTLEILTEIDPIDELLPLLINLLSDHDRDIMYAAIDLVAAYGPKAMDAVPVLKKWLSVEQNDLWMTTASAICLIDSNEIPAMLDLFMGCLKSDDSRRLLHAVWAIEELGSAGEPAIGLLEEITEHGDAGTRSHAASAISKITGDPATEIQVAIDLLDEEDWMDRYLGAEHLMSLGAVADPALMALYNALELEPNSEIIGRAINEIEGQEVVSITSAPRIAFHTIGSDSGNR